MQTVGWAARYERLRRRNAALEARLRGGAQPTCASAAPLSGDELSARLPVKLTVPLEGGDASVEVFRRYGAGSTFHMVRADLPLGLNISLREKGDLRGSFVVEDVLPGGFGEKSGQILPGDALLALTSRVLRGRTSYSDRTFDGTRLVDASGVDSLRQLVEAISRTDPNEGLILVLERPATGAAQRP